MKRPAKKTCGSVGRGLRQRPLVTTTRTCHSFDSESRVSGLNAYPDGTPCGYGSIHLSTGPNCLWHGCRLMHRRQHGSVLHRVELLERVPGRNGTRRTGVWETGRQKSACVGRCAESHCGRAEQPGPHSESPTTPDANTQNSSKQAPLQLDV